MRRKLSLFLHLLWLILLSFGTVSVLAQFPNKTLPTGGPTCRVNSSCSAKWDIFLVLITSDPSDYTLYAKNVDGIAQYCSTSNEAFFLSPESIHYSMQPTCPAGSAYTKGFFAQQTYSYRFNVSLEKSTELSPLLDTATLCLEAEHDNQGVLFFLTDLSCDGVTKADPSWQDFVNTAIANRYQVVINRRKEDADCLPQCPPSTPEWCSIYNESVSSIHYTSINLCHSSSITTVDLAILIAVGIALLIMLIVLFFYIRMRNKRKLLQRVRDRAITRDRRAATKNTLKEVDPWELKQDELQILVDQELGRGAFALVYEGKLLGRRPVDEIIPTAQLMGNRNDKVAVKRVPPHADALTRRDFLDEVEFMKKLGYHAHVLGMIGCMTSVDLPLIVLEFCENGDLLGYLKKSKEAEGTYSLSPKDLLSIAWQISDGMVYLKSLDLIHRDLAARNVLLNRDLSAKISDFGLCRQPDSSDSSTIYISRGGRLPVKWMAIESLRDFHFSFRTDVWSFGVVLWEMYSFGEIPFADVNATAMLEVLLTGQRLPQLAAIPDPMYKLMTDCWWADPEDRKDIEELRDSLNEALSASSLYYGYLSVSQNNTEELKL